MKKNKYKKYFSGDVTADKKHQKALKVALDTRKFEIELYWKRATYFWAFIAATFVLFGLVQRLGVNATEKEFLSFSVCCLGLVLSVGWVLANRGSKQWQENWEHHVDHLEDKVMGPLYKITMPRISPKSPSEMIDFILVGPSKHSVSKINQLVSLFITFLWLILLIHTSESWSLCNWQATKIAIFIGTIICILLMLFLARSSSGTHWHAPHLRKSKIVDEP